jgi:transcriptional regulator with XRE-family HTH domain
MKHQMGRRTTDGVTHPIDVQIGRKIAARRTELGINLALLASKAGLTQRRLQKFENGRASAAASELVALAAALDLPVFALFEDVREQEVAQEGDPARRHRLGGIASPAETEALLHAYQEIRDPESRRMLVKVIEKLAVGYDHPEARRSPVRKRRPATSRSGSGWLN